MTDSRRKTLLTAIVIAVLVIGHGGLVLGLALAGEWRVWRFITNAVAQLDAFLVIAWLTWSALSVRREWKLSIWMRASYDHPFRRAMRRLWQAVMMPVPPLDEPRFDDDDVYQRAILGRAMLAIVVFVVIGIAALPSDSWEQIYVLAIGALGFAAVGLVLLGRQLSRHEAPTAREGAA